MIWKWGQINICTKQKANRRKNREKMIQKCLFSSHKHAKNGRKFKIIQRNHRIYVRNHQKHLLLHYVFVVALSIWRKSSNSLCFCRSLSFNWMNSVVSPIKTVDSRNQIKSFWKGNFYSIFFFFVDEKEERDVNVLYLLNPFGRFDLTVYWHYNSLRTLFSFWFFFFFSFCDCKCD